MLGSCQRLWHVPLRICQLCTMSGQTPQRTLRRAARAQRLHCNSCAPIFLKSHRPFSLAIINAWRRCEVGLSGPRARGQDWAELAQRGVAGAAARGADAQRAARLAAEPDHYAALGLPACAPAADVRAAFRCVAQG